MSQPIFSPKYLLGEINCRNYLFCAYQKNVCHCLDTQYSLPWCFGTFPSLTWNPDTSPPSQSSSFIITSSTFSLDIYFGNTHVKSINYDYFFICHQLENELLGCDHFRTCSPCYSVVFWPLHSSSVLIAPTRMWFGVRWSENLFPQPWVHGKRVR